MSDEFELWLSKQDEPTKALLNARFEALENTVKATRKERDDFRKELKEAGLRLEKGSDAEKTISELSDKLTRTERKANFLELAHREGCSKPGVVFSFANAENLFLEDGNPDWKKIKESVPEFFKTPDLKTNAGSGTTRPPAASIDDAFRQAANKQ